RGGQGGQGGDGTAAGGTGPVPLPGQHQPHQPNHPVRPGWETEPRTPRPPQWPANTPPAAPAPQAASAPLPAVPAASAAPTPHGAPPTRVERYRGPDTALAAERARQARMTTVGAVTERWAPEQAGPVYEHWRLAPPVGPAADFWALGVLLFRAVQGYPPYPEDSAAELTQAVCAEQPAFAEDCGALRPVVESLLRQDPTERPSAEELRGWLRSLLRSAPEPEVGQHTVTAPPPALEPGRPADPRRLPIVRRRGPLVGPLRRRHRTRAARGPRHLGRMLLAAVLAGLVASIASVVAFMSDGDRRDGAAVPPADTGGPIEDPEVTPSPSTGGEDDEPAPEPTEDGAGGGGGGGDGDGDGASPSMPGGFESVQDPAGFSLAVPEGFRRQGENAAGQVIYADGPLEIVVVSGRDSTAEFGDDLMDYQLDLEPELEAYRADSYASSRDVYDIGVGDSAMVTGVFAWREGDEQRVAFNQVVILDGHYHVVMVRGPASQEAELEEINETTSTSYAVTD
ncbi:protein kinase, partial [Streptomyces sp. 4N509B]